MAYLYCEYLALLSPEDARQLFADAGCNLTFAQVDGVKKYLKHRGVNYFWWFGFGINTWNANTVHLYHPDVCTLTDLSQEQVDVLARMHGVVLTVFLPIIMDNLTDHIRLCAKRRIKLHLFWAFVRYLARRLPGVPLPPGWMDGFTRPANLLLGGCWVENNVLFQTYSDRIYRYENNIENFFKTISYAAAFDNFKYRMAREEEQEPNQSQTPITRQDWNAFFQRQLSNLDGTIGLAAIDTVMVDILNNIDAQHRNVWLQVANRFDLP